MNQTRIQQILRAIQTRANEKFDKHLWREVNPDEDLKALYEKGSKDRSLPKWKREYYAVLASEMQETETVIDEDVAKQKDAYIDDEIAKEIKAGRLPSKEEIAKYVSSLLARKVVGSAQDGGKAVEGGR